MGWEVGVETVEASLTPSSICPWVCDLQLKGDHRDVQVEVL